MAVAPLAIGAAGSLLRRRQGQQLPIGAAMGNLAVPAPIPVGECREPAALLLLGAVAPVAPELEYQRQTPGMQKACPQRWS